MRDAERLDFACSPTPDQVFHVTLPGAGEATSYVQRPKNSRLGRKNRYVGGISSPGLAHAIRAQQRVVRPGGLDILRGAAPLASQLKSQTVIQNSPIRN